MNQTAPDRILVIKLGALGDMVLALGPFAAIRYAHQSAHITLLTTGPYAELAEASGYFDAVWTDTRPSVWDVTGWLALRSRLRGGGFKRVYDLQTSDRSGWYYRIMGPGPRPEWSGIASGCSHPHANPDRDFMHSIERQNEQLAVAGIDDVADADISWLDGDIARFGLPERFVLLVPGGARHRPEKRWPVGNFAVLAKILLEQAITPVILGSEDESAIAKTIVSRAPGAVSLVGRTSFGDIASLVRTASGAIGNDTGPMHLAAAAGCPTVVLFSAASDPVLTAPRGSAVTVVRRRKLSDMPVSEVAAALSMR